MLRNAIIAKLSQSPCFVAIPATNRGRLGCSGDFFEICSVYACFSGEAAKISTAGQINFVRAFPIAPIRAVTTSEQNFSAVPRIRLHPPPSLPPVVIYSLMHVNEMRRLAGRYSLKYRRGSSLGPGNCHETERRTRRRRWGLSAREKEDKRGNGGNFERRTAPLVVRVPWRSVGFAAPDEEAGLPNPRGECITGDARHGKFAGSRSDSAVLVAVVSQHNAKGGRGLPRRSRRRRKLDADRTDKGSSKVCAAPFRWPSFAMKTPAPDHS